MLGSYRITYSGERLTETNIVRATRKSGEDIRGGPGFGCGQQFVGRIPNVANCRACRGGPRQILNPNFFSDGRDALLSERMKAALFSGLQP